jgi:hypothetical protein
VRRIACCANRGPGPVSRQTGALAIDRLPALEHNGDPTEQRLLISPPQWLRWFQQSSTFPESVRCESVGPRVSSGLPREALCLQEAAKNINGTEKDRHCRRDFCEARLNDTKIVSHDLTYRWRSFNESQPGPEK